MSKIKQGGSGRGADPAQFVIDNWKQGWDTLVSASRLQPNESPDMFNVYLTEDGIPQKAPGTAQFQDMKAFAPRIRGLGSYYVPGATDYQIMVCATNAFFSSNATNAFVAIAGVTIPNDTQTNLTVANGNMYFHTGSALQAISGSGLAALTISNPPSSSFGIYWKGIHFIAGTPTNTSRVYLSRSTDPSVFITSGTDAAGFDAQWYDVNPNDGDKITGLAVFRDNLIIFKERAIYRGVPTDATSGAFFSLIDNISKSVGCVSHRTIDAVDNDIYYLSRRGVMVLGNEPNYFDVIRTNEISAQVHDQIDGITPTNLNRAAAITNVYKYHLAYPFGGTTYNNRELIWDTRYSSWTNTNGININCYNVFIDPRDRQSKLYYGDDNQGVVGQLETTGNSFLGAAYNSYIKTAEIDLGHPELIKFWEDVDIQFKNTQATMEIDVYLDGSLYKQRFVSIGQQGGGNGIGVNVIGYDIIGLDGLATSATSAVNPLYRIPIFKNAKKIQVVVQNPNSGETWTLMSVRGSYTPLSHFVFDSTFKL